VTVRELILAVLLAACAAAVILGVAQVLGEGWAKIVGGALAAGWCVLVFGDDGRPPMLYLIHI
jgi:hypothetical protein